MLRSLFASFSTTPAKHTMVNFKTPPGPTVPTAVKAREELKSGEGVEHATFASGCFWGTEHLFTKHFGNIPNFSAISGYTGGQSDSPSYRQVCTGATGHAEAVNLTYPTGSIPYAELVEFFYRTHDPTTVDRQGPDTGSQYRSAIFYNNKEQEDVARKVTAEVQEKYLKGRPIVTQIAPVGKWFKAEDYHQHYLDNNPGGYECPTHRFYW
ncbi:peptide-methionine (S)-S-oxide reductase [Cryptococcus amylolentus CBS 6039]|uniref:peptide-methionine (S)-S-oxide reductase n=1 Tax=Cryptococcus amylolentus CBS 6039 TaxID=1295533 RepID=A0A1E3HM34_9TREE|nr:peptide-methionine (S)-S-oxide reductase [Cryptococcus amylolentus CBS 6039]ODN77413.1 peptide-methionine (S)-S-oxide reductase [Cryptococcus amylolentus CBS 6039]